jgi:hypothetical protein
MLKSEFDKLSKMKIPYNIFERIEKDYMESNKNKEQFVKSYGKAGIIKAYDEELKTVNQKLDSLARFASDALTRMRSPECVDENGEIINRRVWDMLDTQLSLACDVFDIDRYSPDNKLKDLFLQYMKI